jgi:hypothetical protein
MNSEQPGVLFSARLSRRRRECHGRLADGGALVSEATTVILNDTGGPSAPPLVDEASVAAQAKAHRRLVSLVAGIDWAMNRWAAQEERKSHSPERITHARS